MDPSSFIGVIWDAAKCLCGCVQREADFFFDLETNLKLLDDKRTKLEAMKKDVEVQIEEPQNNPDMIMSQQLTGWLQRVEAIQQKIKDIEAQGVQAIQNKCLCKWCSKNCVSSYKLGKEVSRTLKDVDELATYGKSFCKDFIAYEVATKAIEMPQDEIVGLKKMFDKVWNSLQVENVGVIGLYGMGGVGKTTLLKKIYNELVKRKREFDFLLWVVVSKEPNLDSIMDNIRKSVEIRDDIWNRRSTQDEKAAQIYRVLKQKKFVLFLDDIWESLDLESVGVPRPKDTKFQPKVLFTTRLENVCAKMQAQMKFKIEVLTKKKALELFCMKVGEETLNSHPSIPKLAGEMAMECEGLPLALVVLGSAMAGVKSVEVWEHSIQNLTSFSWTARDLETKVFSILKLSYDKLDVVEKHCFLYCAMYPEDFEILVPDLIDKWMWEKFFDEDMKKTVQDMRGHGEYVIEKLKLSCLLESGKDDLFMKRTVKMHDMIRDMALWLSKQDHENMELEKRILIMNERESKKTLVDPPSVTTLVLVKKDFYSPVQHNWFLQLEDIKCMMKGLKILELVVHDDERYPNGRNLDIGGLISLEYLSIQYIYVPRRTFRTRGRIGLEFWISLRSLTNLKFLSIQCYAAAGDIDWDIPLGVLSSLRQLRVFRLIKIMISSEERRILEELESLPNIEELWINIDSGDGLNKLLESSKLQSCLYNLSIRVSHLKEEPILSLRSMPGLKQLQEIEFSGLNIRSDHQYSFVLETCSLAKLRSVKIDWCSSLTHVTWLKYAPQLQELYISDTESMEEVIKEGEEVIKKEKNVDSCVFSSLVDLTLRDLPKLKSIHKAPLSFPSLQSISIVECPNLKKLPLYSNFAKHNKLTLIKGQQKWWDNLEWDDPRAKQILQSKFKLLTF